MAVPGICMTTWEVDNSRIFNENHHILKFTHFENFWELEVALQTTDQLGLLVWVLEFSFGARVLWQLNVSGRTLAYLATHQSCVQLRFFQSVSKYQYLLEFLLHLLLSFELALKELKVTAKTSFLGYLERVLSNKKKSKKKYFPRISYFPKIWSPNIKI